jgi:hypothetical protein
VLDKVVKYSRKPQKLAACAKRAGEIAGELRASKVAPFAEVSRLARELGMTSFDLARLPEWCAELEALIAEADRRLREAA